jgi:4-amino-4-deoxy-L-arabinose transferase-like glycosyltransferase
LTLEPSRAGALWALGILLALGAAMRFATLDVQSYHHDEVITVARVIHGSFGHMLQAVERSESNPPLYYALAWAWVKAFGTHEAGLRSLSALLGTAIVPLGYCIGAELASRRTALIAAALIAVNPMLIWYSQEARSYALLVFFCALALLFFVRALRTHRGADLALWGLASALALLSHYFAVFAIAIEALWLLVALRGRRGDVLASLALPVAAGLALLPLIVAQINPAHIDWIGESPLSSRFFQSGVSFLIGETGHVIAEPPRVHYALLPVVLIAAAWLIAALLGTRRERRGALIGIVLGLGFGVLTLLAALLGKDYVVERNLLPALVPFAIAAAIGFGADRARRLGLLLAAVLCAYWIAFGVHVTETPNLQRPDFRAITRALGSATAPRAIVSWKLAADPIRWYLHDRALRTYSGGHVLREIDVISKSQRGAAVRGVPRPFRPFARVRFERLTLTRYRAARARDLPFYVLKRIHTGFGFNAVVLDGEGTAVPRGIGRER